MRAVSVPLDTDLDLNDVARGDGYLFVREGVGFAGRGVAASVPVDDVVGFLAAIDHDDRVGDTNGPIAIGSVPFLPGSAATLTVPRVVVGKRGDGRRWITTVMATSFPPPSPNRRRPRTRSGPGSRSTTTSERSQPPATPYGTAA